MEKLMVSSCLFLGALAVLSTPLHAEEPPWNLEKEERQIKAYSQEVADSPYLAVKIVAQIEATAERVREVFGEGESCSEWRAMCKHAEVLSIVSESERYVYMVLDLPWPISDRDIVVHTTVTADTEARKVLVSMKSAADVYPLQKYTRAETRGMYSVSVINENLVEFVYTIHTDLRGDLSPGMINPRLIAASFDDIERLKKLAEG